MRYLRTVAALAAILTVSIVQAGLIAPLAMTLPISLPAVLVAAVALVDGAATGMAFGFTAGLVADLGSTHPAGVLALAWTCLGVVCGMASTGRTVREDVLTAATASTLAGAGATLLLAVVHSGGASVVSAARGLAPCWVIAAVLACGVVPLTRAVLGNDALRAHRPVINDVRVVHRG
jgi:cell shape-determining protein MreD